MPKISLRGLDGRVAQEQLNLLKLAACRAAQLGAGTTKVMWGDAGNASCLRVLLKHLPDHLLAQAIARNPISAIHWTEGAAIRNAAD